MFGALLTGCGQSSPGGDQTQPQAAPGLTRQDSPPAIDQSGTPLLPDSKLTPGVADRRFALQDICTPGFTKTVRNVPKSVKDQVYAEYGIQSHRPGDYEVDHLVSLELGGSNDPKNLWPQSYKTKPWNAHVKDALENRLHEMVCNGELPLETAQHDIATDWIAAYKKYMGDSGRMAHSRRFDSPAPSAPSPQADGASGKVWVNTRSGKYFLPGATYYGKTKEGQYMTEAQAQKQGYVGARGQ